MQCRKRNWRLLRDQVPCAFCAEQHATKDCPKWSKKLKLRHPKKEERY